MHLGMVLHMIAGGRATRPRGNAPSRTDGADPCAAAQSASRNARRPLTPSRPTVAADTPAFASRPRAVHVVNRLQERREYLVVVETQHARVSDPVERLAEWDHSLPVVPPAAHFTVRIVQCPSSDAITRGFHRRYNRRLIRAATAVYGAVDVPLRIALATLVSLGRPCDVEVGKVGHVEDAHTVDCNETCNESQGA
jgi:hypothetical protein